MSIRKAFSKWRIGFFYFALVYSGVFLMEKRLFDLALVICFLPLLVPISLVTALLIWWKIGRPILFKQVRPGLNGSPFVLYKFRTMTDARNEKGELLPDYIRLTKLGSFLRKFSLDELPQFYNVLKGDMSLIGPRPLLMDYLPFYSKEQARRHYVRPGITGWAQIHGRNAISWEDKFKLDIWYVDHHSLPIDLKILVLTVLKVLKNEGINAEKNVTMPRFTGTTNL